MKQSPPMTVLYISAETTLNELHQFIQNPARALYKEAVRLDLTVVGPICWTYHGVNSDKDHRFTLEIALPVDRADGEPDGYQFKQYEAFKHVGMTHIGPWNTLGSVYPVLINKLYQDGYTPTPTSVCREFYLFWDMIHPEYNVTYVQVGIQ